MILEASCSCDYVSGRLFLGGGMRSFRTYLGVPALCTKCKEIKVVNIFDKIHKCEVCGENVILYDDPSLSNDIDNERNNIIEWLHMNRIFQINNIKHKCPRCEFFSLSFFERGYWD